MDLSLFYIWQKRKWNCMYENKGKLYTTWTYITYTLNFLLDLNLMGCQIQWINKMYLLTMSQTILFHFNIVPKLIHEQPEDTNSIIRKKYHVHLWRESLSHPATFTFFHQSRSCHTLVLDEWSLQNNSFRSWKLRTIHNYSNEQFHRVGWISLLKHSHINVSNPV